MFRIVVVCGEQGAAGTWAGDVGGPDGRCKKTLFCTAAVVTPCGSSRVYFSV